eukprot:scaffold1052_cov339-Pavlova_lutheri.AAC.48
MSSVTPKGTCTKGQGFQVVCMVLFVPSISTVPTLDRRSLSHSSGMSGLALHQLFVITSIRGRMGTIDLASTDFPVP